MPTANELRAAREKERQEALEAATRVAQGEPAQKPAAPRIRVMPTDDPESPKLPTRENIAQLCVDGYRLALDNKTVAKNKRGELRDVKAPDYRGAAMFLRHLMDVCGYTAPKCDEEALAARVAKERDAAAKENRNAADALRARLEDEEKEKEVSVRLATEEQLIAEKAAKAQKELDAAAALNKMRSRSALASEDVEDEEENESE